MGKRRQSGWQRLLKLVESNDGLPTRESGSWAAEKLFAWNRYIEITTTAMVGNPKWPGGVNYVDLFCGPGVCSVRGSKERFPGSPLIAANAPKPFSKILLCELDGASADACCQRMDASPAAGCYRMFRGDCNQVVADIANELPANGLTLAFLDPTGLHVHMETVVALSGRGAVDLLILFPDSIDIIRNDRAYYFDNVESNLDKVLGKGLEWRTKKQAAEGMDASRLRKLYATIYQEQLTRLAGYGFFDELVIKGPSGPLYRLVYASKNSMGVKFWRESVKRNLGGQRTLF
ncbi:hypothetical protein V7x_40970 [Crateriforma conspicua]|uniref:Three-Cys-motif partner protein TcmP n=1 Tax=Crateriforma conspicua TaxID=2527996 RepID=A0A5C6FNX0_9PLAN|nr:three-Cys-motif partner protein TcmP [Crateriforma conspicua]TWU62368.1 hypothetical protein V7x_40970 [Crateriforma conspicua]